MCPGTTDDKASRESKPAFEETGPVKIIGFVRCGSCPGKRPVARAKMIVFCSCISRGNPIGFPCLHFQQTKSAVAAKVGDKVDIIDDTH
jgi:predicted metal-binding protein